MVRVFLRNDDVNKADKKFMLFNKILIKNRIPVHHSVIPKSVSESSADELIELKLDNPGLIEYGQHGYSHKNYGNNRIKFEFGSRKYIQQKRDIENGKKIMEKLFGEHFVPVFTPPYHRYNEDTLRALDNLGFKIFSATEKTRLNMENYSFSFVPVSISFNTNLTLAIKKFMQMENNAPYIGIYTHHNSFGKKDFKNFIIFIKYLIKRDAEFCRLSKMGDKK